MTKELSRLEKIKALQALENVSVHGIKPAHHLDGKDIDWLIEQVEIVKRLENTNYKLLKKKNELEMKLIKLKTCLMPSSIKGGGANAYKVFRWNNF